ncbi:MAG: SRPBCC family protein [Acidimicrobiia bacterium]
MHQLIIEIPAPPSRVWAELADLGSHHQWMADAGEIRFGGTQRTGVGTWMRVPTRVGPFRTTDLMTVTEWEEEKTMAVDHVGTVSGFGRFDLEPIGDGTRLTWSEELRFPWWLGAKVGAWVAGPFLKRIWQSNLSRLAARVTVNDL